MSGERDPSEEGAVERDPSTAAFGAGVAPEAGPAADDATVVVAPTEVEAVFVASDATSAAEAVEPPREPEVASRALAIVPERALARVVVPRRTPRARGPQKSRAPSRASRIAKLAIAIVALVGAVAFVGLQVQRAIAAGTGDWVSGDVRAGLGALRGVAWARPEPFVDGLAGAGVTTRVALDPDGRTAVVAHGERGRDATLWLVEIANGRVENERPIDEIDAPGDELAPWFDGATLWFASDREGGQGGLDLYSARFVDGGFERAERLRGGVNSAADDTDPTVHGAELVFASERTGDFDLFTCGVDGGAATRIDALSSPAAEVEPAFARDGGSLWFAERARGASFDLARAFRYGARWLPREKVDALSTAADERAPLPLGDGLDLAFVRPGATTLALRARSVEVRMVRPPAWTASEIALLASLLALATLAFAARDSSRYDTLIAAWAASILVHVALLFALGELRTHAPARPGGSGERGEPSQLRVVPSSRSSTLSGGGRGGAGALERATTDRPIAGGAPAAGSDLTKEIAARAEATPVPGRLETRAPLAGGALPVEDALVASIPRAESAPASAALPSPGRSERAPSAGVGGTPERFAAGEGSANAFAASRAGERVEGTGAPIVLERGTSAAPAAVRGAPAIAAGNPASRPVEEREKAGDPVAAVAAPNGGGGDAGAGDVLALLASAPSGRSGDAGGDGPVLERFERAGSGGDSDATSTRSGPADASFAPGGSSLVDDIPRRGEPAVEPAPRIAATPYQTRTGPAKQRALEEHGGTTATEAAVAKGLAYLARIQGRHGQWGPIDARDEKYGEICVGKTALATLAFLAAGHTHLSNTEHSRTVERALAFLLAVQDEATGHFGDTSAYSHGISTFALAEALATTQDDSLRAAVERAVAHVLERQSRDSDPRKLGGWPYYYADPDRSVDPWPRTSITAWQVLALESARLSGVAVPDAAFDDAARFLDAARDPRGDWYRYSHEPARLRSQYPTLPASTPAALFALSCVGRDIAGPEHAAAREYVLERAPRGYRFTNERDFVERGQGNPYFWYQGTLAMIRVGGNAWKRWNLALQETLLPAQQEDGSWRPIDLYARYARDDERDRAYTTALCVLCLEVYYRYDLPLLSAGRGRQVEASTSESASPR